MRTREDLFSSIEACVGSPTYCGVPKRFVEAYVRWLYQNNITRHLSDSFVTFAGSILHRREDGFAGKPWTYGDFPLVECQIIKRSCPFCKHEGRVSYGSSVYVICSGCWATAEGQQLEDAIAKWNDLDPTGNVIPYELTEGEQIFRHLPPVLAKRWDQDKNGIISLKKEPITKRDTAVEPSDS